MKKKKPSKKIGLNQLFLWIACSIGGLATGLFLLLILLPYPHYKEGFQTLNELVKYGETIDENIENEGKNISSPDYTKYLQKRYNLTFGKKLSHKLKWLLYLIGLKQRPFWSSGFYVKILEDVTKTREKNGLTGGKFIQKIHSNDKSKLIVFGEIYGGFHPLTRYVLKLNKLGILDQNFHITSSDYHFIFLSTLNGHNPYSLETLSIILRLLKENPNNVFFLRSRTTYFEEWRKQPIKDELIFKLRSVAQPTEKELPYKKLTTRFFESLPVALYTTLPTDKEVVEYIRFSPYRSYNNDNNEAGILERLDESLFSKFIKEKQKETIDTFHLKNQENESQEDSDKISMKAILSIVLKRLEYEPTNGLRLLPQDRGATAWAVLSAPVLIMQKAVKFFYDAFVIISSAKDPENWKITLYNRDIRKKENFKESTQKFFVTSAGINTEEKPSYTKKQNKKNSEKDQTKQKKNNSIKTKEKLEKIQQKKGE